MPSQYNLNIKAKLDTSQVRQELQNLRLPGNGGGGGGGGPGQANKEIVDAAKKVNLGALAGGFNRLTGTLNTISSSLSGTGQKLVQTFSEVTSTGATAIQNFRSFGAIAGTAATALDLFSKVLAARTADMRIAATARETARSVSGEEMASSRAAEAHNIIKLGDTEQLQGLVATLRRQLKDALENVELSKRAQDNLSQAQDDQGALGWLGEQAGVRLHNMGLDGGLVPKGYTTLAQRTQHAQQDYNTAMSDLIEIRKLLASAEDALATAETRRATEETRAAQETARIAELEEQRQRTLAEQTANIISQRKGELSLRRDVDNEDVGALQGRLQEVLQTIENLENMGPLSEGLQSLLKQSYSMQDYLTGVLDDLAPDRTGGTEEEEEEKEKELPSWLDGVADRTDDWFHNIGGSIGGENSLQNDEYRVLKEMERLLRESTGYARQTAQAVV